LAVYRYLRSYTALLAASSFLMLALIVGFFLPEIACTYWHVRFGNSATYHGWNIPVPTGWRATTHNEQLIITKPLRFYDTSDVPEVVVGALDASKPIDPDRLDELMVHRLSQDGYILRKIRQIQVGGRDTDCLQFGAYKPGESIRISCMCIGAHLSVDLFGRPSEIEAFYSIVSQIRAR
jgi:hypothetical protein